MDGKIPKCNMAQKMSAKIYLPPQENVKLRFKSIPTKTKLDFVGFTYWSKVKYEMSTKSIKAEYEMSTNYKTTL